MRDSSVSIGWRMDGVEREEGTSGAAGGANLTCLLLGARVTVRGAGVYMAAVLVVVEVVVVVAAAAAGGGEQEEEVGRGG